MSTAAEPQLTLEDHQKALTEVSFLLDIFSSTIDDLMGGAIAPVGRIAGRNHGSKMPIYLPAPTLELVIDTAARQLRKGFEFSGDKQASGETTIRFHRCIVREVCRLRNLELGGNLCRLFHAYLDGVLNEMTSRPTKSQIATMGDQCEVRLETQ